MLTAKSIGYAAEGGSGKVFLSLLDRLGIAAEMKSKVTALGSPTIRAVINGDVEFVFSGVGLILADSAVELVGALPPELQTYAVLAVGVSAAARQSEAARALTKFLTDSAAASVLKAYGVEAGSY